MKGTKITFWITTGFLFLFEGVMPAFTSQSEQAVQGITHLGYPIYFGVMLAVFKVLGSITLIVPQIPRRVKEWAYAGFAIDFIAAFVSNWVVDGFTPMLALPAVAMAILAVSYVTYDKLNQAQ